MKHLLTIGCSFTALYYHPNPKWSYTYLLKEKLGFDKLINLGSGGLSPDGTFRLLKNYLENPVVGKPDFIFIQYPSATRCEVRAEPALITSKINEENWHLVSRTAFREGTDLLRDYEKGKRWTNPNWTDETFELTEKDFEDITLITQEVRPFEDKRNRAMYICPEVVLKCFPSASQEFWDTMKDDHRFGFDPEVYFKILSDPRHSAVNYAKNLNLIESLCEAHNIDYAYIDTDYSFIDADIELSKETYDFFSKPKKSFSVMENILRKTWDDKKASLKKVDKILEYCNSLFTRKNFIHGYSVGTLSPTHIDTYPDLHPGKESHRLFAEKIAGILK